MVTDRVKAIIRQFEIISAKGVGRWQIFDDFADMTLASLEALPSHLANARAGNPLDDTPDVAEMWSRFRVRYGGQNNYAWEAFVKAFHILLESPEDGFADTIGSVYMEYGTANAHTGQFFTPMPVARLMAKMMVNEGEIMARVRQAIQDDPLAQALGFAGLVLPEDERAGFFVERILPIIAPQIEPIKVCDPACGSGIMLLAAAEALPRWAVNWGLVQFYGMDIDQTCVKMARINMHLYGLNGHWLKWALSAGKAELDTLPAPYPQVYAQAQAAYQLGDAETVARITCDIRNNQLVQMPMFDMAEV